MAEDGHGAFIGLDTHKDSITVAVAEPGRQEPRLYGRITNKPKNIAKLLQRLSELYGDAVLLF